MSFWERVEKPVIGLSPMDGVTDAVFRHMVCSYSRPGVVFTEFTNVEGLARGAVKMLTAFRYSEIERPVVGQIYGVEVDSFYKSAMMLCALGFDGIDINMGCPANKVAKRGSGAGLIKTPKLAKQIVVACQQAAQDWSEGRELQEAGVPENIIQEISRVMPDSVARRLLPVSVKTRIGYDTVVAEEWVRHLLEAQPAAITMHGRTLKQMYLGQANWEVIGRVAEIVHREAAGTVFLGNGDVQSMADAREKIAEYGVDGVLVGRATYGDPWFFAEKTPTVEERILAAKEHISLFTTLLPELPFHHIKKHLAWYLKGFEHARETRAALMQCSSSEEAIAILERF